MEIKVKKLTPKAEIPQYAHIGDAALDVKAVSRNITDKYIEYGTGLSFEIPQGYVMLIFPRSSVSNQDLSLANCVGVLDSTYRGELKLRFRVILNAQDIYEVGDKVGQILVIPYPVLSFKETDELSTTDRGSGGFGSTGK